MGAQAVVSIKMEVSDTFAFLLGNWTLSRWIEDRKEGSSGRFVGKATVNEASDGIGWYREAGNLCRGHHLVPASRSLKIFRESDGGASFHFPDGRFYIEVDLTGESWAGNHLCGGDIYRINMRAQSSRAILEQWRVRGPGKCYDALTFLRRESCDEEL